MCKAAVPPHAFVWNAQWKRQHIRIGKNCAENSKQEKFPGLKYRIDLSYSKSSKCMRECRRHQRSGGLRLPRYSFSCSLKVNTIPILRIILLPDKDFLASCIYLR